MHEPRLVGRPARSGTRIVHCRRRIAGGRHDSAHAGQRQRHRVVHAGFRIERTGVPVARSPRAGNGERALLAVRGVAANRGRRIQRSQHVRLHVVECLLAQLGREIDQVIFRDALSIERRRPGRKRLRRPGVLGRDERRRDRPLDDRPHGFASKAIQHIEEAVLVWLHDRLDAPAVDSQIAEDGRPDVVVLPQIVVNHLEVPDAPAGFRVERDQRVGVEVRPGTPSAVRRRRRRGERDVDISELLVSRHRVPGADVAGHLPRFVAPRIGAEFACLRDHVKRPQEPARLRVKSAHVFGRRRFAHCEHVWVLEQEQRVVAGPFPQLPHQRGLEVPGLAVRDATQPGGSYARQGSARPSSGPLRSVSGPPAGAGPGSEP